MPHVNQAATVRLEELSLVSCSRASVHEELQGKCTTEEAPNATTERHARYGQLTNMKRMHPPHCRCIRTDLKSIYTAERSNSVIVIRHTRLWVRVSDSGSKQTEDASHITRCPKSGEGNLGHRSPLTFFCLEMIEVNSAFIMLQVQHLSV